MESRNHARLAHETNLRQAILQPIGPKLYYSPLAQNSSQSGIQRYGNPSWVRIFDVMACLSCKSERQAEFEAEMNIHFASPEGLDKAGVWVFPKLMVCFDCGSALFTITETELRRLESGIAA